MLTYHRHAPALPPQANGVLCNDGNPCTLTDTCSLGTCLGGNPKVCTASDQCHMVGTCDTTTGTCSNPFQVRTRGMCVVCMGSVFGVYGCMGSVFGVKGCMGSVFGVYGCMGSVFGV